MAKVTVIFSGTVPAAVGQDPLRPWRESFSGGEDSLEAIRVPADHPESLRAACQQALEAGSDFLLLVKVLEVLFCLCSLFDVLSDAVAFHSVHTHFEP